MGSHIVGGGWSVDMFHLSRVLLLLLLLASVSAQDYGPVNLDSVDALTLSWNQVLYVLEILHITSSSSSSPSGVSGMRTVWRSSNY